MKNNVGVLHQRCIEAKVFKAFLETLEKEIGLERARTLAGSVVRDLAFEKGGELCRQYPNGSIVALADLWKSLREGGSLDLEFVEQNDSCLHLHITRCGYAEAYQEMGIADLG